MVPVAIVGRGCVLPGALDPDTFWRHIAAGSDLVSEAEAGAWGMPRELALTPDPSRSEDRTWSSRGGYVRGFEGAWNPAGFHVPAEQLAGLDPLFLWLLHAGRQALGEVRQTPERTGAIIGNLSFPSGGMARYAQEVWRGETGTDPRNRFMSGLPAQLLSRALGLKDGAFALDAACASSLYALKLAADRLADGEVDLMLAGAVNRADDLFIHVGFCALQALSRTGRSRPFHAEADGLLPSEGAVLFALKRLEDAERDGDRIFGVIRGIGLSNDGRDGGILAPDAYGQVRAMRAAYEIAGLRPADVGLVECHATGTPVGDAVELASMGEVFAGCRDVPIGSVKSNLGHPITAAGAVALLKVLGAIEHGVLPPTLHADRQADALKGTPFRLLTRREAWPADRPRRASVSAFGFGGSNAHLLVEAHGLTPSTPAVAPSRAPVAIVAVGAHVGATEGIRGLREVALEGRDLVAEGAGAAVGLSLPFRGLRFPPKDLAAALPQQLMILEATGEALAGLSPLPRLRTGVFVGMGADAEVCRYGARWRLAAQAAEEGWTQDELAVARDRIVPVLESAGVVGSMPNIPANRLHAAFDLAGPGFVVSSEELSGVDALRIAERAVATGELDAAVVGAVDLSVEPVHQAARRALDLQGPEADVAVVLVLQRLEDARAAGHPVLAVLGDVAGEPVAEDVVSRVGHAHAASGLLEVAAAALSVGHGARPSRGGAVPWLDGPRAARVYVEALGGRRGEVGLYSGGPALGFAHDPPQLAFFAGADREEVLARLRSATPGGEGPARLGIVAGSASELAQRARVAIEALERGLHRVPGVGVAWCEAPLGGELASIFTGAGAASAGAGREFLLAWPQLAPELPTRSVLAGRAPVTALEHLWSATQLCQAHAGFLGSVLGVGPDAVLGYSSGESNMLLATGAWRDLPQLAADVEDSGIFSHALAGSFDAVQAAWGVDAVDWSSVTVRAPVADVEAAVAREPRAYLLIVHTPNEVVLGGDRSAVQRVVGALGVTAHALSYGLSVHAPVASPIESAWRELHTRDTHRVPGVRFYRGSDASPFVPTRGAAAEAITAAALATFDLPAPIERAWADGVRIFVEHGPRDLCARWIGEILGDRPHLCISLDRPGRDGVHQALEAAAWLHVAGVDIDLDRLRASLASPSTETGPTLDLPCHWPPVQLPPRGAAHSQTAPRAATAARPEDSLHSMPPAPWLPPILGESADKPADEPAVLDGATLLGGGQRPRIVRLPEDRAPITEHAPAIPARPAPSNVLRPSTPAAPASLGSVSSAPVAPAPRPAPPISPPRVSASASHGLSAMLLAEQQRIAAAHAAYLTGQARVHEQFLEMRTRAMQTLLGHGPSSGVPAPRSFRPAPRPARAPAVSPPAPRPGPARATPKPAPVATKSAAPEPVAKPVVRSVVPKPVAAKPVRPAAPKPAPPMGSPAHEDLADPAATPVVPAEQLPGLKLGRKQMEIHSGGRISEIFGQMFERQDGYERQVRMPEPPLLLADRLVGVDCEPGVLGKGTLWTETDITADSWYLHQGRMPAGVLIEAGQADLMLISYMGVDFLNCSERVYRLLGCTLTYHGHLPKAGSTLRYDIHIDGHAEQGDIRLFFFHYDCVTDGRPMLSVRGGQAGFFTEEELADSAGVLWDAETGEHDANARVDPPDVSCSRTKFGPDEIAAFANGDVFGCFGPGWEFAQSHNDTPRIAKAPMQFFQEISELSPAGGPWGKGYLRASWKVSPDDWFFEGHFKNDPCMPGTLMFEGCLQALAFYLTSLGYTIPRDGWRFEPVPEHEIPMRCRGQVLPDAGVLTYEIFVEEVISGPVPTIYADLLCTVDGLKAFHARRCGLRLVPAWPLDYQAPELVPFDDRHAAVVDGFRFDYRSMLACAWGRPSEAFGPMYERFDGTDPVPRLPGPPYHFITRALEIDGPIGGMKVGTKIRHAYDIPPDVWYFEENGAEVMPFAVLLEAALQPCGWLASYVGSALTVKEPLFFRNLDGTGTQLAELTRRSGELITEVTITSISQSAGMIIESFEVRCLIGDTPVYEMSTVFGFFPGKALANQKGLAFTPDERAALLARTDFSVDLTQHPARYFDGSLRLPTPMLCMLDRVVGYWPEGGAKGLGRLVSEKDVDPNEWFFKAHFFQDPVQPGSLGIEALIQLLQFWMLENDLGEGMEAPRFEGLALDAALTWKYRGQVVPRNKTIRAEIEITASGQDERGVWATADGYLWVDELRIYAAKNLGMRIVSGPPADALGAESVESTITPARDASPVVAGPETVSLSGDPWVADHCPTWTLAALPMMDLVDRIGRAAAAAYPDERVVGVEDVLVRTWVTVAPEARLNAEVTGRSGDRVEVTLRRLDGERPQDVASGVVQLASSWPAAPAALEPLEGLSVLDPYGSGQLFHGPAFQLLQHLIRGHRGSTALLDAGAGGVPASLLRPGLLDAGTHGIPHDRMSLWSEAIGDDVAAYPLQVSLRLFDELPTSGEVRVEARFAGFADDAQRKPVVHLQWIVDEDVVAEARLVEVLMPKGPIGMAPPADRVAFLRDRQYVPGLGLSRVGQPTRLAPRDVLASDWLPGTVAAVYGAGDQPLVTEVVMRDHVAGRLAVHPSAVGFTAGVGSSPQRPMEVVPVTVQQEGSELVASGEATIDLAAIEAWWAKRFGTQDWPVADMYYGMIERFVRRVVLTDPEGLASVAGRGVVYVANHQVAIESLLFSVLSAAITHMPTVTIAKAEHRQSWLGRMIKHCFSWPGVVDPRVITFFDREDKAGLAQILGELAGDLIGGKRSMLVHVEGTRANTARQPVVKMSGALVDMAIQVGAPVVPVRFVGGLPIDEAEHRFEFPVGDGRQDIFVGTPIDAAELGALPLKERKQRVLDAINALGPPAAEEVPLSAEPGFSAAVDAHVAASGADRPHAVILQTLRESGRRSRWTERLLAGADTGTLQLGEGPQEDWLAEMASRLYGPRGPQIERG